MTHIPHHETKLDCRYNGDMVRVHSANPAVATRVLNKPATSGDTRSQFVWVRFPNGDLVLGVFPQGDTYFEVEDDARYSGPITEPSFCARCREYPAMVTTRMFGSICCDCAEHIINKGDDND